MESKTLKHGMHALTGGHGPTLVLVPGWPQTIDAFQEIFPFLTPSFEVWALDPPGLGDSKPSTNGYDTETASRILAESIEEGVPTTAYHLAAQFPDRVRSLTLLNATIPGLAPPLPYPLPPQANIKLWQFAFNSLSDIPEILTAGRERELFDWLYETKAIHPERITRAKGDRYVQCYAAPGAMARGFEYYRALATSAAQNHKVEPKRLFMPVLALGGQGGAGLTVKNANERMAPHVQGGEIADCGHYVAEEQPEALAGRLLNFWLGAE